MPRNPGMSIRKSKKRLKARGWFGGSMQPLKEHRKARPRRVRKGTRISPEYAAERKRRADERFAMRSMSDYPNPRKRKNAGHRIALKLPKSGHTGMIGAKGVDVITKNGRIVEVKLKR